MPITPRWNGGTICSEPPDALTSRQGNARGMNTKIGPAIDAGPEWWSLIRNVRTCLQNKPLPLDVVREILVEAP